MSFVIRNATPADAVLLRNFIWAIAQYHGDKPEVTSDFILQHGFNRPEAHGFVLLEVAGAAQGFAKYYYITDFPAARLQLDLDMLWINDGQRGKGYGRALIKHIAKMAVEAGCGEFRISARKTNPAAIALYRTLNLTEKDRGDSVRFTGNAQQLAALAA